MAEPSDEAQRTEDPTPKRLEEARRRGDAPKSQEAIALAAFAAAFLGLWLADGPAARDLGAIGAAFIDHPHEFQVDAGSLQRLYRALVGAAGLAVGGVGLLFCVAALLSHIGQARPAPDFTRLAPALAKISPIEGLKRIYGPAALFNFLKGLFKILIVGAILVYALWPDRDLLARLVGAGEPSLLRVLNDEILKLFGFATLAMMVLAAFDYAIQVRSWKKRLRMTKEEVRRELKESEGDPIIRGRLKRERDMRGRRRMVAAVKDATVLIMNPTHYAVALRYDETRDEAPVCLAKGADETALRMRAAANENGVPVVENPPLARALHASVEIDGEIPVEHYEAVARVIGVILRKAGADAATPKTPSSR
jgi:flagellar biosynthetic protein FlhB